MDGWIIGAAVTAAVLGIALGIHYRAYRRYYYVCARCSTAFTPPFWRSLFALNGGKTRMMKCPVCGRMESVTAVENDGSH